MCNRPPLTISPPATPDGRWRIVYAPGAWLVATSWRAARSLRRHLADGDAYAAWALLTTMALERLPSSTPAEAQQLGLRQLARVLPAQTRRLRHQQRDGVLPAPTPSRTGAGLFDTDQAWTTETGHA